MLHNRHGINDLCSEGQYILWIIRGLSHLQQNATPFQNQHVLLLTSCYQPHWKNYLILDQNPTYQAQPFPQTHDSTLTKICWWSQATTIDKHFIADKFLFCIIKKLSTTQLLNKPSCASSLCNNSSHTTFTRGNSLHTWSVNHSVLKGWWDQIGDLIRNRLSHVIVRLLSTPANCHNKLRCVSNADVKSSGTSRMDGITHTTSRWGISSNIPWESLPASHRQLALAPCIHSLGVQIGTGPSQQQ